MHWITCEIIEKYAEHEALVSIIKLQEMKCFGQVTGQHAIVLPVNINMHWETGKRR